MTAEPSVDHIFQALPDAVLLIGPDNRIARANPVAENLVGRSAKSLSGVPAGDLLSFPDSRLSAAIADPAANLAARRIAVRVGGHAPILANFDIRPLPADDRWRLVSIAALPSDGPAPHARSASADSISVRATDILAHEIKNPLAAIRGSAQLLRRRAGAESEELADLIVAEVARIAQLMDRVQTLSVSEPSEVEPHNVHELVRTVLVSTKAACGNRPLLRENFDPSLPDVMIHSGAFVQVLDNLVGNAVHAVRNQDDGEIVLMTRYGLGASLSARSQDRAVRLPVEIVVRDNGPGVPPELEADMFSPFVTTKRDGQGLGLALVRKLMSDMNGRVSYEREENGRWTQFVLHLPVAGS